ncbi:hypothetical protein FIU87_14460 [Bacillus sp. THAF10]|nr:hypothetical protein FIU87_14460 [Bacillus sp. THAF10]
MNLFSQFIISLYSPKTMATFRFQGIGKTILYIFFLVLVTSIPLFISFGTNAFTVTANTEEFSETNLEHLMIVFIVLGYLYFCGIKFVQISMLALVGLLIKSRLKRTNLQYRHTWRLSAYAVTLPTLLFSLLQAFQIEYPYSESLNPLISFGLCTLLLFFIIKEIKVKKPQ